MPPLFAGPRRRYYLLLSVLVVALGACAPPAAAPDSTSMQGGAQSELQRTAWIAFHRMEVAFLESGVYTTNALVDLQLPSGVKWTLQEFGDESYRLLFTDDNRPGVGWLVSPSGVVAARIGTGEP